MPRARIGDAKPTMNGGLDAMPQDASDSDPFAQGNPVALTSVDTGQSGAGLLQTQGDLLHGGLIGYNATDTYDPDTGTGTYRTFLDESGNLTVQTLMATDVSTTTLEATTVTAATAVYVNETSNANMTTGMTLNQGAADDEILDLKSSDVVHGMTGVTETDTYGFVKKAGAGTGGTQLVGLTEDVTGVQIRGLATNGDITVAANSGAAIFLDAAKKSGTGIGSFGSASEFDLVAIRDDTACRLIFTSQGNIYYKGGLGGTGALIMFDEYDDASLLETYRISVDGVNHAQTFDYDIEKNKEILIQHGIVKQDEGGELFVNHKGLNGLLMDAIRQGAHKQRELEARIARLETKEN